MSDPDPTRVVADADVLVADLFLGGPAREALDHVRRHSWMDLVASDALLADARAVIRDVTEESQDDGDHGSSLAADWYERIDDCRIPVDHPEGDHPGLASAYRGNAAHLLTFDPDLSSAKTGLSIQPHVGLSIRHPDAFATVFDPEGLYLAAVGEEYPGPDRDPRA